MSGKRSRYFLFLIVAAVILGMLGGCATSAGQGGGSEIVSPENSTSAGTEDTSTSAPDITDAPQTAPAEPLSLTTPGGVILIGVIGNDSDGWYFTPEQPLDIEYTYFVDHPLTFTGISRIGMFDTDIDGVDKTPYIGETVTVSGELRTVRDDMETLYFFAFTVEAGKTLKQSCAVPDLKPPVTDSGIKYDPDAPLPEAMSSKTEDGHYVYNPYMLSLETVEHMGNGFAEFYVEFVDAFLNYRTDVSCPDRQYADMLWTILGYEFPLYVINGICDYSKNYDEVTHTLKIQYSKSRDEHERLIREFVECANGYLADARPEQSEQLRAETVYHALCTSVKYDYDALKTRDKIEPYYAYVTRSGICSTFATTYSQLLTQVGIRCTLASGYTSKGEPHAWDVVSIDGINYFCDPTYELGFRGGSAFLYFGCTTYDRANDDYAESVIIIGRYSSLTPKDYNISETRIKIIPLS